MESARRSPAPLPPRLTEEPAHEARALQILDELVGRRVGREGCDLLAEGGQVRRLVERCEKLINEIDTEIARD